MEQFATRCPQCQTPFRVTQAQLEQRDGQVRCSVCRNIFDGVEQIFDHSDATSMTLASGLADRAPATPAPGAMAWDAGIDIAPAARAPSDATAGLPSGASMQIELDALSQAIAKLQAQPWPEAPLSALPEFALDEQAADDDEPTHDDETKHDDARPEPAFIRSARHRTRGRRVWNILLWLGIPLLTLALAGQVTYYFRNDIAARSPQAALLLRAFCAQAGCTIRLPMQLDQLSLATSQLDASPLPPPTVGAEGQPAGAADLPTSVRLSLVALLRNQGDTVQAWPSIDLQLKDADGKAVVRKAFLPAHYLRAEDIPTGMPAYSEMEIRIPFELAGEAPAGFELTLFYH